MKCLPEEKLADALFEMANLKKHTTGLPVNVYCSPKPKSGHNLPRIKFQSNKQDATDERNLIPMSIEDSPRILADAKKVVLSSAEIELISKWMIKNQVVLLDFWNDVYDSAELVQKLQKV